MVLCAVTRRREAHCRAVTPTRRPDGGGESAAGHNAAGLHPLPRCGGATGCQCCGCGSVPSAPQPLRRRGALLLGVRSHSRHDG
jgi:hypothetical protein